MKATVKIESYYENGEEFESVVDVDLEDPGKDLDDLDDWAYDELYTLTGVGPEYSHLNAGYSAEILKCDTTPSLVGRKFEWGI